MVAVLGRSRRRGVVSLSEDAVAAMAALSELADDPLTIPQQRPGSGAAPADIGRTSRFVPTGRSLEPDEHVELRRLHDLARFGELRAGAEARYAELRRRHTGRSIPAPRGEAAAVVPRPRLPIEHLDWDATD